MLKISESNHFGRTMTLQLEGRVVGPWVAELRQTCELILSKGNFLKLDLSETTFLDSGGVDLLSSLRSRGVTLVNPSAFLEEQLKLPLNG